MKKRTGTIFFLLSLFLLVSAFGPIMTASAQQVTVAPVSGEIKVTSDIEMMIGVSFSGGGHVAWTITGDTAHELRILLIDYYDGTHAYGNQNDLLEVLEMDSFKHDLDTYLTSYVKNYGGVTIRDYRLLNSNVETDMRGLLNSDDTSTGTIEIDMYFDAHFNAGSKKIDLASTVWHEAIFGCIGESNPAFNTTYVYEGRFAIDHSEYVISTSAFIGVNIDKGNFMLLRTPAGEIYTYNARFSSSEVFSDTLYYSEFDWIECPLILFIVVILFGFFVATMPNRVRVETQPKVGWLHAVSKIAFLLLLLFTFLGSIGGMFISGIYIWILTPTFLFIMLVLSKSVYGKMPLRPTHRRPAPPIPTTAVSPSFHHREEKTIIIEREAAPKVETKPVQCTNCGEIFEIPDNDMANMARCPACSDIGSVDLDI